MEASATAQHTSCTMLRTALRRLLMVSSLTGLEALAVMFGNRNLVCRHVRVLCCYLDACSAGLGSKWKV